MNNIIANCGLCSHAAICLLRKEYFNLIDELRSVQIGPTAFKVELKCKHYLDKNKEDEKPGW